MIVRACDVYDSQANEVAVLEYISKLQDASTRLEELSEDSAREVILQEIHDLEKPEDLDDLSPSSTQQLVSAQNSIDLWLADNIYKPIAAKETDTLREFITSMTENKKFEGEFTSLEAMQTLKVWSHKKQQGHIDVYISLLESFHSMQRVHNEKVAGSVTIIKEAGDLANYCRSIARVRSTLAWRFRLRDPEGFPAHFQERTGRIGETRFRFGQCRLVLHQLH